VLIFVIMRLSLWLLTNGTEWHGILTTLWLTKETHRPQTFKPSRFLETFHTFIFHPLFDDLATNWSNLNTFRSEIKKTTDILYSDFFTIRQNLTAAAGWIASVCRTMLCMIWWMDHNGQNGEMYNCGHWRNCWKCAYMIIMTLWKNIGGH